MSNNDEVNVKITATSSGLSSVMDQAAAAVRRAVASIRSEFALTRKEVRAAMDDMKAEVVNGARAVAGSFSGLVDVLATTRGGLVALAAVAIGVVFGKAAASAAQATEDTMDFARAIGLTTNRARELEAALADVGAPTTEYEAAAKGLSRSLRENEADMNKLGLKTRDAAGHFRPLNEMVLDGIEVLNQYKEGADRNVASQFIFGRGIDASSKLLLLNRDVIKENAQAVEELGLQAGANAVAAWQDFDAATDRSKLSLRGMANAIGQSVMPMITDLIRLFNAVMPAAIVVVRGALSGLTSAFLAVKNGIVILWEVGSASFMSLGESIRVVVEALGRAMTGDFSGALSVLRAGSQNVKGYWKSAMADMVASSEETAKKIAALFMPDNAPGDPGGSRGKKTAPAGLGDKSKGPKDPTSYMAYYEMALEEERRLATERDALHGMSKQAELEFWQNLLQYAQLTEADKLAVSKKAAAARIAVLQQEARDAQQITQIAVDSWQERSLAAIEMEAETAKTRVTLWQSTERELLQQELGFEQRRYEIRRAALTAKLATLDPERDPVQVAQTNAQIEALELQHQQRMAQLRGQVAVESTAQVRATWEDAINRINGLWTAGINAMMQGTLTWRSAFKAIGTEIVGWFANAVIGNMVKEWLLAQTKKLQASVAGWAAEKVAAVTGAAATTAVKAGEATAVVTANAAEAASGAAASQAAIPVVGPGLAAAAFASIGALVLGALSMLKSAAGGYDIPAGVNPLVQAHAREMILPAKYADVIRGLAGGQDSGGGESGSGGVVQIATQGGDFVHKNDLGRLLKQLNQRFVFV